MLFKTLNLLVSVVYPVVASYNALEYYTRLSHEHSFGRISVGGINVNLGEMLKSAMNENAMPVGYTEKAVEQVSLVVQKWLIYWIVLSALTLAETVLVYVVPFYQFFKFPIILYLISPMALNSGKLAVSAIIASEKPPAIDNAADWRLFQQQGCGFIYFLFIKPFLDGEVDALMKYIPFDKLKRMATSMPLSNLALVLKIGLFKLSNRSVEGDDSISSEANRSVDSVQGAAASFYEEEFDMVDKPVETDNNLRLRDKNKSETKSKGWLW